jgi:hypothetical protein
MDEAGRGALICFYDPGEDGKNITLRSEGYERNLSMMIGAAVLEDKEMKKYILKGVEAAMVILEERKKNKNKNKTKYAEA